MKEAYTKNKWNIKSIKVLGKNFNFTDNLCFVYASLMIWRSSKYVVVLVVYVLWCTFNTSAVVGVTITLFINTRILILLRHVLQSGSELCGPLRVYIPSFYGCKAEWRTVPPSVHSCLSENKVVCKRRTLTSKIVFSNWSPLSLNFDKNINFSTRSHLH